MKTRASSPAVALNSVSGRWNTPFCKFRRHGSSHHIRLILQFSWEKHEEIEVDDVLAKLARIEAVLFLAKEPIASRKVSQYANLADGTEARTLVRQLNRKLDKSGRSFRIEEVAGGFQLVTRSKFAPWLRRLSHVPGEQKLSTPALETLAVVAYRQPVIRATVESIRGVSCGEMLNQLLNRDLIRVCGRSEELGRPYLYGTTKRFLRLFGLRALEQLPRAEVFANVSSNTEMNDCGREF